MSQVCLSDKSRKSARCPYSTVAAGAARASTQPALAHAIGSVAGNLIFFSLVLLTGYYLLADLPNPILRTVLASIGVIVLLPLGSYFLVRAVKEPLRAHARARKRWNKGTVPAHLVADVAAGTALTIFNPSTMVYWIGVTSNWLPFANSIFGSKAPGWRILMAAASLKTWFTTLIVVVQFTPTVSARPSSASSTLSSALSSSASLLSVPWSHPAISCTETQGSGRAPNRRCRKYQVVVMGVSLSSGISMNGPAIR